MMQSDRPGELFSDRASAARQRRRTADNFVRVLPFGSPTENSVAHEILSLDFGAVGEQG